MKHRGMLILLLMTAFCGVHCGSARVISSEKTEHQITATSPVVPLFTNESRNVLIRLRVYVAPTSPELRISSLRVSANPDAMQQIDSLFVYYSGSEPAFGNSEWLSSHALQTEMATLSAPVNMSAGLHYLWLAAVLKPEANLDARPEIHITSLTSGAGDQLTVLERGDGFQKRIGFALRKKGDDGVHTYRIPGIATTDKGSLIAVYDIRYHTARDLPGDIDVGMSRSTDGGKSWQPMKIIMDMGAPHEKNGIGDPAILFDPVEKTIWVAALWSHGNRSIAGSIGGISPDSTGQFMLAYSRDDGLSWSDPVNITPQVKQPEWTIFFQGPGSGIAMKNGTLVFPAQYWDENRIPFSTIIYSTDHGLHWKAGAGAKSNTTESAVAETQDGKLLLNMRDNRGKYRSTAVSADLGKHWTETENSYQALPDPVCMGSMIRASVTTKQGRGEWLFFSNENNQYARTHMTIKASPDDGKNWPRQYQLLIDQRSTYGYSSLTQIDEHTLGLLYEGAGDVYFVRVPVNDIVNP